MSVLTKREQMALVICVRWAHEHQPHPVQHHRALLLRGLQRDKRMVGRAITWVRRTSVGPRWAR